MALTYRIYDQKGVYFITCTVNQWVDVFTRKDYVDILLESLRYCQKNKGLEVFSWVVMTNHIHLIISTKKDNLSDIIRDFKKFTASQITVAIKNNAKESRKNWLLWLLRKDDSILFWQEGYHAEEITGLDFFNIKQDYIHLNPVRAGLVEKEEDYLYSSCGAIYGVREGLLELSRFA
ncbi:MAG TPA: transposase [Pelobium sp.]|nr:transposase [Pelobium sp.]